MSEYFLLVLKRLLLREGCILDFLALCGLSRDYRDPSVLGHVLFAEKK